MRTIYVTIFSGLLALLPQAAIGDEPVSLSIRLTHRGDMTLDEAMQNTERCGPKM